MRLLLDTHVLIWWDEGARLNPGARRAIAEAEDVYVSAVSAWEIAIKSSLGRLRTLRTVAQAAADSGFAELPVTIAHAERVGKLPWHHRDPFDRLLAAQAMTERLTLVTRDPQFKRYSLAVLAALLMLALRSAPAHAQDNYEIQVYPSETVKQGSTMFELHSNFTADGRRTVDADGVLPTHHALHETIEITHGFTPWFEIGFYTFTSAQGGALNWVGNHIRPRIAVPESWHWPVGVSLSQEIGYQKAEFSADIWTWEIRPIVDKQFGRLYVSLNPTLELSLKGPGAGQSPGFSPNAAVTFDVTPQINLGFEYYGAYGPLGGFDPAAQREQAIYPAINLNLSPDWEFNAGVGIGLTGATDRLVFKTIVGRRFHK